MQVANDFKVAEVNVFNEGNVGAIEGEFFLQSPSVADGKPKKNTEENQFTKEELSGSQEEEKGDMVTDKNILVEANSVQNAGVVIQTTELAEGSNMDIRKLGEFCKIEENMDNVSSTKTTSIDQSFEGEDKNQKTCSSSVGMEMDPETLQPCQDIEDKMLSDGATDVCMSNETTCANNQKTEEATESGEASKDKLGSLSVTALIEETSSAKAGLDNLETFKEESGTGLNGILIIKQNKNEILENIATADSSLSTTDKVDENPEPKGDVSSKEPEESQDLAPTEASTMECEHEGIKAVVVEDNIMAEKQEKTETSKHEEQLEQSFMQNTEPTEKLESPLDVASEEIETTTPDEYTEMITTIEDKTSVGSPAEIFGETRQDELIISDDINNKEIPEEKIGEELETTSVGEGIEKQAPAEENKGQDWSMVPAGEELETESSKEDATMKKMPKEEVLEVLQTADESANVGKQTNEEDGIATDNFTACAGEETKNECCYEEKKEAKEPDTVVWNSNTECIEQTFDSTHSMKKREAKDKAESNDGWNAQSIAGSSEEETVTNESILDIVENSPVPEISKEEILEKADSRVTVVAKETRLTEADAEYAMQIDSSDLVSEEQGLVTTETSENESNRIDIIVQREEASNLGESKDMEISITRKHGAGEAAEKTEPGGENETHDTLAKPEDQREISTAETSLDDISKQNLQAPCRLSLEEHNLMTAEVSEKQTIEEESCTEELDIIYVDNETVNKVTDLDLTPIQSLEVTSFNNSTDMAKPKVAQVLNQESEASPATILREFKPSDKPVKAFDASSDSTEITKTAETSQQYSEVDNIKLEETSTIVSQLPIHVQEKANSDSITVEKADANYVEVEEIKIPELVSESKDQSVEEIHETGTSLNVGETNTNEIEKQIREVPGVLFEHINQGVEAASSDEIVAPTVVTEETSFGEVQLIDKPVKALDTGSDAKSLETTKTADTSQQDAEVDSTNLEETCSMVSDLPTHEHEKVDNEIITEEKSHAIDVEVEETKIPDAVSESRDHGVEDSHETGRSLTLEETDANKIENQNRVVPEELSEPTDQGVETASNDEIAPSQTLQDEKIEEQLLMSSSTLVSNEEDSASITIIKRTENGSTKKDENANNVTVEKSNADEVKAEETKILDAVSDPNGQDFEEIYETRTSPMAETTDTDKMEEAIKEVTEKISDPMYKGVEAVADGQTPDQPLPVAKLEEQLHASKTTTTIEKIEDESTDKVETEVDKFTLEESAGILSKLPTIEHKDADNVSATIEKSDADHVEIEEGKTSESISESKVHGIEEIHEIVPSPTVEKTHTDEGKEEIKAVPETTFEANNQGFQAIIDGDITPNQTLPTERNEQLQEPSSALLKEHDHESITKVEMIKDESTTKDETQWNENVAGSFETGATEKPCLQDEGPSELEVSNLYAKVVTVQDTQNQAPEEESITLEEVSTAKPQEYIPEIKYADSPTEDEKTPVQCSSQDTSKDEGIMDSRNSNKDSDNLPPHSTVKEHLPGEVGEKCGNVTNLEFEKTGQILKFISEIHNPELPSISEGTEIKKEQHKGVITELRDGGNHIEETTEADEAIKKDASKEEITEEDQVVRYRHPVSPHEETDTKSNQEDELRAENHPGEGATETFDTTKNETQHKELFEESEKAGAEKNIKEMTTAEDETVKDTYQVSVGDGTAKISPPEEAKDGKTVETAPFKLDIENQPDATNFKDTATEATTPIKEAKSSEIVLAQYEKAVPAVTDTAAAAEEAPAEKVSAIFEEVNGGLTHGTAETYEEKKEIASADTNNSESLIDNENREHKSPEPACEGNGVTKGLNLKEHVEDLGSDAPVMVEASRDMDVKIARKKSQKILSGVGLKVKHSIAKVKKVITGKSSHPKTASPK